MGVGGDEKQVNTHASDTQLENDLGEPGEQIKTVNNLVNNFVQCWPNT